jgi:PAS domain S-box-containing protein
MESQIFRNIVEGAHDPVFIQTEGRFSYLNPAALRLFGVDSVSEIVGTPLLEWIHPDFHSVTNEAIRELNYGGSNLNKLLKQKIIQSGGNEIWTEASCEPIVYNGQNGTLFKMRDTTPGKKTETELSDNETFNYALLRFAGTIASFGGWSVDLGKRTDDGKELNNITVYWSDTVSDIHGTPRGYSPGAEEAIAFYAPECRERITMAFNECMEHGTPYDEELVIINRRGRKKRCPDHWRGSMGKWKNNKNPGRLPGY